MENKKSAYWAEFENGIKEIVENKINVETSWDVNVELLHYDFDCDNDVKVIMCKFEKYDVEYVVACIDEYNAINGMYILEDRQRAFDLYLYNLFIENENQR